MNNQQRREMLALQDANNMADWSVKDIAEWLQHFEGYPCEDPELGQCEREAFIENGATQPGMNFRVVVPDEEPAEFETMDKAYEYFQYRQEDIRYHLIASQVE